MDAIAVTLWRVNLVILAVVAIIQCGLVAGALGSYGNRDGKRLVKKMVSDRHLPPHCGFLCLEV